MGRLLPDAANGHFGRDVEAISQPQRCDSNTCFARMTFSNELAGFVQTKDLESHEVFRCSMMAFWISAMPLEAPRRMQFA